MAYQIHRMSGKLFSLIGISREEAAEKFGYMLEVFEHGTRPMGVCLDSIVLLCCLPVKRQHVM